MDVYSQLSEAEALTLTAAVLLYTAGPQSGYQLTTGEPKPGKALAMICDALPLPGAAPVLGPGRMLTRDTLDAMVRSLDGLPQVRQMIPERVLLADGGRLAWWTPSARRPLFIAARTGGLGKALTGKLPWHPALLFVAEAGRLSIHALAEDVRPGAKTKLFIPPYFNLWQGGRMCNGNVRMPQSVSPDSLGAWETAFFETTFTHPSVPKLTSHKRGHDGLWQDCAKDECAGFPVRHLIPQTALPQTTLPQTTLPHPMSVLKGSKGGQITAEMAVCG